MIACKGGFPDLISRMMSDGVQVKNQNSGQGVFRGLGTTCNYDGCCKVLDYKSDSI